jgi:hypothetical protein
MNRLTARPAPRARKNLELTTRPVEVKTDKANARAPVAEKVRGFEYGARAEAAVAQALPRRNALGIRMMQMTSLLADEHLLPDLIHPPTVKTDADSGGPRGLLSLGIGDQSRALSMLDRGTLLAFAETAGAEYSPTDGDQTLVFQALRALRRQGGLTEAHEAFQGLPSFDATKAAADYQRFVRDAANQVSPRDAADFSAGGRSATLQRAAALTPKLERLSADTLRELAGVIDEHGYLERTDDRAVLAHDVATAAGRRGALSFVEGLADRLAQDPRALGDEPVQRGFAQARVRFDQAEGEPLHRRLEAMELSGADLALLCSSVGVGTDELAGDTSTAKTRELAGWLQRRGLEDELDATLARLA